MTYLEDPQEFIERYLTFSDESIFEIEYSDLYENYLHHCAEDEEVAFFDEEEMKEKLYEMREMVQERCFCEIGCNNCLL